jgi:hypothetical protein
MRPFPHAASIEAPPDTVLPALLLSRYLFFLTQRPISTSNTHYVRRRIHGLQSLAALLDPGRHELLATGVELLRTLEPANLHELAERIELTLLPFAQAEVPTSYIAAEAAPPPELLRTSERILLVLGPAIGIGDEIVTFPLAAWIKRVTPRAELTTMTAYDRLWDGVAGVDRVVVYRGHDELVRAIRGEHAAGRHDLVLLVDFENPELYRAVAHEPQVARYAELSVGARVLAAVDNRSGWTYHQRLPDASFRNVYDGFDELARRLGVVPDPADRFGPPRSADAGEPLRVFVSPFSSKYDPSPVWWSALVSLLAPSGSGRPVELVLDPGPNARTRRFAAGVARAAAARAAQGVSCSVAGAEPGGLALPEVFEELARTDVVLCADSFAAHAAPRYGCTTLVVASPGLESWRVPSGRSYYFDAERPLAELVTAMRPVLALHGVGGNGSAPPVGDVERRLARADAELADAVSNGSTLAALCTAYERFGAARHEVVGRVAGWPPDARALTRDHAYDEPARSLDGGPSAAAAFEADTRRFVQNSWLGWRNTNLRKYLAARLSEAEPC